MAVDTTKQTHELQLSGLLGEVRLRVEPLEPADLQALLHKARETGWYGNIELMQFVLKHGIAHDADEASAEYDVFLGSQIAREIWLLTLRQLRRVNLRLHRAEAAGHVVPSVRRYSHLDLATPGLLTLISGDLRYFDSAEYFKEILSHMVAAIGRGKEELSEKAKDEFIADKFETFPEFIFKANRLDARLIEKLPESLFPTKADRYVAAERLLHTLDWAQYRAQLVCFNRVIHRFVFRSNQLGGLHMAFEDSELKTGLPGIFDLLVAEQTLPFEVLEAFLSDLGGDQLALFSPYRRRQLRHIFRQSAVKFREPLAEKPGDAELAKELVADVVDGIQKYPKLVREVCLAYPESFSKTVSTRVERVAQEFLSGGGVGRTPACRVLVEGDSDAVILQRGVQLLGSPPELLSFEPCGGKGGVLARLRQILKAEPWYVGGIAAVLDGDAAKEEADAIRLTRNKKNVVIARYREGEIEDQFRSTALSKALNELHPSGNKITASSIPGGAGKLSAIRLELRRKKRATLNKAELAEALASQLDDAGKIPRSLKKILVSLLNLAEKRRKAVGLDHRAHLK